MSRAGTGWRMALGGAACGGFLGIFAGGVLGGLGGGLFGDLSVGLDGALFGGGAGCLVGALYGLYLATEDGGPVAGQQPTAPTTGENGNSLSEGMGSSPPAGARPSSREEPAKVAP